MKKYLVIISALILPLFGSASVVFAGNIAINGSTTVLPIAQKVAEAYMKENPNVSISVSGGGSGNGIKALIDKTTDIADSSRFIKDSEVRQAVEKGVYPVPFAVAYDCIVPVVHPSNPLKDISLAQLKAIYEGKVRNWKELGGPNKQIVAISRDTSSGTYEVWEEKVLKKARVYPGALLQASNGAVAQAVSKNSYAIGYIGVGYINKEVKPLTVEGVEGTAKTALDGSFSISRALYMFTPGWPGGEVLNFINYVLHPVKGQKYVKEAGFVPLYQ
ncbi:MAG: phosphate ABC transporter substrate-binding protein [Thermodesulfobacteriota bacterium]